MTRVYEVTRPNYANFTVQVVNSPAAADLLVHRDDKAAAEAHGEGIWSFVGNRENAHAAVYVTPPGRGGASLKICYVKTPSLSGWMRGHKLKGRLSRMLGRPAFG